MELVKEIEKISKSSYDKSDPEVPYSFVFKELDLSLWRQAIPYFEETMEELPEEEEGKYFWTVGIGAKGYYDG